MMDWLRRMLRVDEETIDDLQDEYDEEFDIIKKRLNEIDLALVDLNDRIYPLLKKLNTRAGVREYRENEKDIKEQRTGIMRGYPR
jgi:predicted  nucleic acid-binding Zn-ribbon protein